MNTHTTVFFVKPAWSLSISFNYMQAVR